MRLMLIPTQPVNLVVRWCISMLPVKCYTGSAVAYLVNGVQKNYMSQLIFIPWQQARVAVNPGSNYIYVGGAQRTVYASGVVFRQFDFTQTLLPDTVASTALLICVAGTASYSPLTLNNCTITTYANTANLLPENTRVGVSATQSADLNNTIINVLAVGDAISDPARSGSFYGAYRGSCKKLYNKFKHFWKILSRNLSRSDRGCLLLPN